MKKNSHSLKYLLLLAIVHSFVAPTLLSARTKNAPAASRRANVASTTASEDETRGVQKSAARTAEINVADLARQESLAPATAEEEPAEFVPAPMPMPRDLPVPAGAKVIEDLTMASAPSEAQAAAASPAPSASFAAYGYTGHYPPDTHGAVGPAHLVTVLNGRFGVQDRSGNYLLTMTQRAFWSRLGANVPTDVFDPKVLYDPYGQRFIMTSCATRRSADSSVLIAVSQTADPTGNWNLYRVDADAANESWADFPSIGFNKNWIVVHMNMFDNDPDAAPVVPFKSRFWVFDKSNLYAGGNGAYTEITGTGVSGTIVPAVTLDPTLETMYLLQNWNGNSGGQGYLRYYTITGTPAAPVMNFLTTQRFISTLNPWASNPPSVGGSNDFAPQLGSVTKIQANDARMHSVVYRNGSLWGAHTVFLPAGTAPLRSAIQWWQINPANDTVVQRGRIDDALGLTFYAFPSIAVNKNNDVLVGYSRFRATEFGSAAYSYRAASDAPGTMRDDALLKAGEDTYVKSFEDRNRWGDYSATVVDPLDDTTMWTIQEYAAPRSLTIADPTANGQWATWWGRINSGTTTPTPTPTPTPQPTPTPTPQPTPTPVPTPTPTPIPTPTPTPTATPTPFPTPFPEPRDTFVSLTTASTSVNENAGSLNVTVTRTGNTNIASFVSYATANGTASDISDYAAAYGTLNFAAGETSKTFTVFIVNDTFDDPNETFTVSLVSPASATIAGTTMMTVTIASDDLAGSANPVKAATFNAAFFVRQHYIDFFNREPDASGLAFWSGQATNCGNPDLQVCRDNVSAAFFVSTEFQETGYFVYKMYKAAYGNRVRAGDPTVPLTLREFLPDLQQVGRGVVVGPPGWEGQLLGNKFAYVNEFVFRPEFLARYPLAMSNTDFVNALNANTGHSLTEAERINLISRMDGNVTTRGAAMKEIAENAEFSRREYNRAFVLMQYFGYLRRNPYDAPEFNLDFGGYNFWLGKLNSFGGNYITSQMVRAFITAGEYEQRFGQ